MTEPSLRDRIARTLWLCDGFDANLWDEVGRGTDPSWISHMYYQRPKYFGKADAILKLLDSENNA